MKYLWFPTLDCKDIWITKSEFVAKTQFLSKKMGKERRKRREVLVVRRRRRMG